MSKELQYAFIPVDSLEINFQDLDSYKSFSTLKLQKISPYNNIETKNIAIQISKDDTPYVEEVITKNKIGLNKNGTYKVYLPGEIIYYKCTENQVYQIIKQENYLKEVNQIFEN